MEATGNSPARRPLASRQSHWARTGAAWLAAHRVAPNHISMASIGFAALSGVCFWMSRQSPWWLLGAAACIQLRLICNLMDGMVAIEGGLKSRTGDVFNDLPDRFADLLILVPPGYAAGYPDLGWCAGAFAVFTAYVRTLGGALQLKQDFVGPMAKQQRMAVLTVAALSGIFFPAAIALALAAIAAGSLVTVFVRAFRILKLMDQRP
jgi:phosphatidylglycerophosphate synthase